MTKNIQNIKKKFIIIILIISIISGVVLSLHQHNIIKQNFQNNLNTLNKNINNIFNLILKRIDHEVTNETNFILEDNEITKAFSNQDREKLQNLVTPFYEKMCKQNPYLKIMTFRLVDGTAFLRVHKPSMFGDKLNKKRKIIIDTNRLKKKHFGFEVSKLKMTYRIVTPIFYKKQHIGLVEIGVEPEYIANKLNKLFSVKNALLVKKDDMSISLDKTKHLSISKFILVRGDKLFKEHIKDITLNKNTTITTDDGNTYIINSDLNLLDHKKKIAAKLLLAYNINKYLKEIDTITKDIIIHMSIFMLIFMLILNYFTNSFIKQIDKLNLDLIYKTNDLKRAQDLAQIGSWRLHNQSNELTWSDTTYDIFGIDKTTHQHLTIEDFFKTIHPDDLQKVSEAYENHLETKKPYLITHRLLLKDGTIKYVEERCETTFDKEGNALVSNGTVQDITKRKESEINLQQKEQQLIQQSRLAQMGEMISMIAHQWRQPLNAISATTNNLTFKLMMNDFDNKTFQNEIKLIQEYSQHLSTTIDDFRDFFKEDREKERTTLKDIINSTLDIVKVSVENKNIKIITKFNCDKQIETYTSEIKQVVLNIIKNAEDILLEKEIKNPTITIETSCKDHTNQKLIIKDNAGGIPDDIMDKIFDPYFSTKLEKDGTGLGLYMSKTIIQDHCNGKIKVRNDSNGAVFEITLKENKS
jgi:PAS domain S-box-containing protein